MTGKHMHFLPTLVGALLIFGCTGGNTHDDLAALIEERGAASTVELLRNERAAGSDRYDFALTTMSEVVEEYYQAGQQDAALAMARYSCERYPDSVRSHRNAALLCHLTGLRSEARDHITRAFALDTLDLSSLVQMKRIKFVPLGFESPALLTTDDFSIRPILPDDAELDYRAIMSSLEHLRGVLGRRDWPDPEMTLEEDRQTLVGHAREHRVKEGFCYTVMSPDKSECLGCVYLYPARWDDHNAEVVMWVSKAAYDRGLDTVLYSTVRGWVDDVWPFERVVYPGREVPWGEYFGRLADQDKHRHW